MAHKAEELIKNFGKGAIEDGLKSLDPVDDIILLAKGVDLIPTVDAVEVVRCWECKFGDRCSIQEAMAVSDWNAYCFRGERKDND